MAYSDFTLDLALRSLALTLNEREDLFAAVPEADVTPLLRATLEEYIPLATSIHTEKARSEFIVAPILAEIRRQAQHRVSLFSGIAFDVDREKGLNGVCDFLFSRSPVQLFLRSPVMAVVEAKNDNINGGLGQCVAEMVAARIFNERAGQAVPTLFGAVTTGSLWKFLKLAGVNLSVDRPEYYLDRLEKIVGILLHCVECDD